MNVLRWQRARRLVQRVSFVAFLWLVMHTARGLAPSDSAALLVRLDPLAGLAAMLAGRQWLARFLPALALLTLTLVLGRFWCGWLCPLGSLLEWTSPRKGQTEPAPAWRSLKYGALFTLLFAALWGNLTLLVLDPIALFIRGVTTLILPGLTLLVTRTEMILFRAGILREALRTVDGVLRGTVITSEQSYYPSALWIALVLGGLVALNWVAPRAWCRYGCPLGALYGLVAKVSWLKRWVTADCVHCGACSRSCQMGTVDPSREYSSDPGECIQCLECAPSCPTQAIRWRGGWRLERGWSYDPSRRQALGALGASLGLIALAGVGGTGKQPSPRLLRPPGVREQTLLTRCVRCGACLRACPTAGLQPSLMEAGLEGLWTPVLVPRLGHCAYNCTACGHACPTGAIPALTHAEKLLAPIGAAYIDPSLCIPWSGRGDCIVCEEMCPLPEKAISLLERGVPDALGAERVLLLPVVDQERCLGCGLCEQKCPVVGKAAIRVRLDPMGA